MDLAEFIETRRSIRKYRDLPLDSGALEKILRAGLMAPSTDDVQPWYFVVVRSPEAMRQLKAFTSLIPCRLQPKLDQRFPQNPEVAKESCAFFELSVALEY